MFSYFVIVCLLEKKRENEQESDARRRMGPDAFGQMQAGLALLQVITLNRISIPNKSSKLKGT